ncbi:coagulation factor VII-like isoform X1 [Anastrepha obliqua]|uniref:coagulation factor VII-like isoform X1 n=1 Tax=Anastrepha obliqua TaxID=95512 RepID=UPI00240983D1|nr:coagulation factor VII-like isoform X1 [Anastrepha obliqua]
MLSANIFLCSISMLLSSVTAQLPLPPIACPQFFQYVNDGYAYFGKITLPQVPVGTAEVRAHFTQRGLPTSNYYGRIIPYPDESTVVSNVLNRQPATFRVDFVSPSNPPKLTLLSLDGVELCVSQDYPSPRSWSKLSYRLYTYYTDGNGLTSPNVPISLVPVELGSNGNYPASPQFQPIQPANQYPSLAPPQTVNTYPNTVPTHAFNTQTPPKSTQTTQGPNTPPNTSLASPNLEGICGREGTVIRGFVYGGVEVARGQFPWLTAIYKKDTDALSFKCGGSLVSRRTVISAAHCFRRLRAEQIVLYFGRYDLESYSEDGIESRNVDKLIIHPEYENDKPNADIALLQIEPIDKFSRYIQPICLWSETTESSLIVGRTATVVGWGYEGKRDQDISPLPKMVDVTVVSKQDCLSSSAAFQQLVTDNTICAGNRDGTGPCMGDSGGGLMVQRNGRWVLRGIVSVGQSSRQHCNLYEYVVYCDMAKYVTWVRQNFLD